MEKRFNLCKTTNNATENSPPRCCAQLTNDDTMCKLHIKTAALLCRLGVNSPGQMMYSMTGWAGCL